LYFFEKLSKKQQLQPSVVVVGFYKPLLL